MTVRRSGVARVVRYSAENILPKTCSSHWLKDRRDFHEVTEVTAVQGYICTVRKTPRRLTFTIANVDNLLTCLTVRNPSNVSSMFYQQREEYHFRVSHTSPQSNNRINRNAVLHWFEITRRFTASGYAERLVAANSRNSSRINTSWTIPAILESHPKPSLSSVTLRLGNRRALAT